MRQSAVYVDRATGEEYSYRDYTDLDTAVAGREAPFEDWEGDNTALVHVLWSLRNSGLIAGRPGRDEPLRQAIFDRLFGEDKSPYADLSVLDDIRAIVDAHDPRLHPDDPNVVGASRLTRGQVEGLPSEPSPRQGGDALDLAAGAIQHSRWNAAQIHQAIERAKVDAADSVR